MAARIVSRVAAALASVSWRHVSATVSVAAALAAVPASRSAMLVTAAPSRGMAVKTKSSVKKRFRVNGNGQIVRKKSGKRHLNIHKSSAQLNRLGKTAILRTPGIRKRYIKILNLSPLAGR